jgi:hypothetical protein
MMEEQLGRGIALAKAGKKSAARNILAQVVKDAPRSVLGWLWLASVVETQAQQRYCLERALQINPQNEAVRQTLAQLQATEPQAATGVPYVAKPPAASESTGDLKPIITNVFGALDYEPYYTGRGVSESVNAGVNRHSLLLNICQEIYAAGFGIFDLSSGNPNAYLEMGIALGLNRPIIATAQEKTPLPPVLRQYNVILYADYSDLERLLSRPRDQGFPPTPRPEPDYCYFCGRVCESASVPPDENSYLVLSKSKLLWRNLMQSLTPHLAGYHLYPAYLMDQVSEPTLCDVRKQVLSSRFVLCHLGILADEGSFLALGMAVGSRTPWILLSKRGQDAVPSNLQRVDRIEYSTLADLEGPLTNILGSFLGRIMLGSVSKSDKTTALALPFWTQLEDWIGHIAQPAQASSAIRGSIRVAQYDGQECVAQYTVPGHGMLVGRGQDCNVIIGHPSASYHHFRILKGRTEKYFVEDLNSKNGTFLNGKRLPPGERIEVGFNDAIRIPGARFLIWDDRPLPTEKPIKKYGTTSMLPPILRIEIPDVPPPTYLSTWDHPMVMTILLPDGHNRSMFEVQGYYPMGKILAKLAELLDLPDIKYCFKIEDEVIDDNETPLSVGIERGQVLTMVPKELGR